MNLPQIHSITKKILVAVIAAFLMIFLVMEWICGKFIYLVI